MKRRKGKKKEPPKEVTGRSNRKIGPPRNEMRESQREDAVEEGKGNSAGSRGILEERGKKEEVWGRGYATVISSDDGRVADTERCDATRCGAVAALT